MSAVKRSTFAVPWLIHARKTEGIRKIITIGTERRSGIICTIGAIVSLDQCNNIFSRHQERMVAHAPERPHSFAGRSAIRRRNVRFLVGTATVLLLIGCRSVGPRHEASNSNPRVEESPSRRNTLSPLEQLPQDRSRDAIVQTSEPAEPHADRSDVARSLIEIMSFVDQTESTMTQNQNSGANPHILPVSAVETSGSLRMKFPEELPGAMAPGIELPEANDIDPDQVDRKKAALDVLFPAPTVPTRLARPSGRRMTLEELEELALQNNPTIAQALAAISMSQGTAIQAGVSPNPTVGYEADTVGSSYTRNYQGVYLSQPFKTAGKLALARSVANVDLMNSQLYYERTKLDVLHQVRSGYYSVLVAQESLKVNEALVSFSNQIYEIMVDRLKSGNQAAWEISQLNSLVNQARGSVVAAQNSYVSAWKQLAASTGLSELPNAILEGRVDMPVPNLDYDALMEWVLSVHPDLQASSNLQSQSKINLELQKRIPIPDITVGGAFQNDFTTPGFGRTSYNLNISVPVPLFDRNQGNIRTAQGKLNLTAQSYSVTKNSLTSQLADAFNRYQTGRVYSEYYRTQILPDMARAYRGVYDAHINFPEKVVFGDIIVAQQNLAGGVSAYINFLLQQWLGAADIANLIQLRNFRELFPEASSDTDTSVNEIPPPAMSEGGQP